MSLVGIREACNDGMKNNIETIRSVSLCPLCCHPHPHYPSSCAGSRRSSGRHHTKGEEPKMNLSRLTVHDPTTDSYFEPRLVGGAVQGVTPTWFLAGWTVFRRNPVPTEYCLGYNLPWSSCDDLVYMWMLWLYSYAPGFAKLTSSVRARAMMINLD
ncbi:uncharacterized protein LOC125550415 isoform X2 [Triticum urartu]|uniref:Uncharacterized protein n=1 Tax=Triticum urartu TaxID=4572 RepID=A0A8R7U2R5_TRIUA|nr:uncharacterized protein LOC125550415 isoform X2 [Triticum urartu]